MGIHSEAEASVGLLPSRPSSLERPASNARTFKVGQLHYDPTDSIEEMESQQEEEVPVKSLGRRLVFSGSIATVVVIGFAAVLCVAFLSRTGLQWSQSGAPMEVKTATIKKEAHEPEKEIKAHVDRVATVCGSQDTGMDYGTKSALKAKKHISTADLCQKICQSDERCGAWTWGFPSKKSPWTSETCYLKQVHPGEKVSRTSNKAVVSGLVCRKASSSQVAAGHKTDDSVFCCSEAGSSWNQCGTCHPGAKFLAGSYCASENNCAGCGGTWCSGASTSTGKPELIKGVSYGPSPKRTPGSMNMDDFFCDEAKKQWGSRGRGDLEIIKSMGANTIRLYGNNVDLDHEDFLNTAHAIGLKVIPGMSDWPYVQSQDNCAYVTGFNCYGQLKYAYSQNLKNGFLRPNNTYHPAISHVISINEPDMKLQYENPDKFCKGIMSGIDGMLDAENEAGVVGVKPKISVTFSFSTCDKCEKFGDKPALGQMWALREAFLNPAKYGYKPRNDLAEFYKTRFVNSFNTANPSDQIPYMFLDSYTSAFPDTPVFIGEYHNPNNNNREADVTNMLNIASKSSVLTGLSFFEWMMRTDEGGHLVFGMFESADPTPKTDGGRSLEVEMSQMSYFGTTYNVPCLVPVEDAKTHKTVPMMVAAAFGGLAADAQELCELSPEKVPLNQVAFEEIMAQNDKTRIGAFVRRLIWKLGGKPLLGDEKLGYKASTFPGLVKELTQRETKIEWVEWQPRVACVVDHLAEKEAVNNAILKLCGEAGCGDIPTECKSSIWDRANFIFGRHYQKSGFKDPMSNCDFAGTATLTSAEPYQAALLAMDASSCLSYNSAVVVHAEVHADATNTSVKKSTHDRSTDVHANATNTSAEKSSHDSPIGIATD